MADRVVSYDFRGNFTNLTAGLAAAGAGVQDFGGKLTALDKNGAQMRAGLSTLGGAAGKFGLVAAAGLGAAVLASANFDQAMSNVQAATHETASNMELLRAAALKAGADTAFSATEAAAGVEELAKAGISTADILAGGLTGALDLAAAGGLDVAQAAEISATALTQFKLAGEDVGHVADLLAAGAGKAQGSVEDMGMALKQSGLVAAQTGLTVEETTGTLAAFASAGLIGSDAGTSFKTMLQSLTPTGEKARKLMDELGISAYDAQGNFVGMTEFAASLQNGLKDLSVEQQNAAMKTIFGSDAVRAASVVFEQGADGIQGWIDKTNDAGYAAETAATRMDNLKGDLEQLKGSLETALIGAGDGSQGPLRSLVQNITKAINAFNDLSPAAQSAVTSMAGITAVLGGGLWFTSKVVNGIASTKEALKQLGVTAESSARSMAVLKGSLALGAAVATLAAVDSQLDKIGAHDFSDVDLGRQLEAFADGEIVGNLDQIGNKLSLIEAASKGMTGMDKMWGWIPGVSSDAEDAATNIEKIDQALAGLVEGGDPDQAARVFEQIQTQAEAAGISTDTLSSSFDAYKLALRNANGGTESWISKALGASDAADNLGQSMDQAGHKGAGMAARMEAQAKALEESRKAAREGASQFVGLGDSLDKAKVSLVGWLHQLEKQAAALRDFRENAQAAAKKGLDEGLIQSLNAAGPAGALRMKRLADTTDKNIDRANKAWRSMQREVDLTTDAIGGVPKEWTTNFHANTGAALIAVGKLGTQIANLHDKTVTIHVQRTGDFGFDYASGGQRSKAAGGYIAGPGTATSDSIPARLSNGEYVVKAASVAKYGIAMFDALNAQRFANGGVVGYASGGPVTGSGGSSARGVASQLDEWLRIIRRLNHMSDKELATRTHLIKSLDDDLHQRRRELTERERILSRELEQADKKWQAERDLLKEMRDARRSLMQDVSGNFMSGLFGGVDLLGAIRTGALPSEVMTAVSAFAQANNMGDLSASEQVQAYLDSLSPEQIAALQGQATAGTLAQDTRNAQQFQQLLQQLSALGLDGGLFQELAASGNISAAQYYATLTADQIDALEQQYEQRNQAAQSVGQMAANSVWADAIKEQTKESRAAREEFREAKHSLHRIEGRLEDVEKAIEHLPKPIGDEVGAAINGAVASGQRRG